MKHTVLLRKFKRDFGQANHHLITTLVGLDPIQKGLVTKKPETFSTSWNPKCSKRSGDRARNMVLKAFLAMGISHLDTYLNDLNRDPKYIPLELQKNFDECGRSVSCKAKSISSFYPIQPLSYALIYVAITWRNNTVHGAKDKISKEVKEVIESNREVISKIYCGLSSKEMIHSAENGQDLSFKETASLIKAIHNFVAQVDIEVTKGINDKEFCRAKLIDGLKTNLSFRKKYYERYEENRKTLISNFLRSRAGYIDLNFDLTELLEINKPELS